MAGPPAGWYEDSERPGFERWWDGSEWTDHRRTKTSTEPIAPIAGQVEVQAVEPLATGSVTTKCPVCHEATAIQRMSVAIDSGFSSSAGSALTVTTRGEWASTGFTSASSTALSARIAPPPRPAFQFRQTFIRVWIVATIIAAIWFAASNGSGGIGFAVGLFFGVLTWIPALLLTIISKAITAASYSTQGADWDRKAGELRSAYYCARDDVVFNGDYADRPEVFRARIFES